MEAFIDSVQGIVANPYEADRRAGNRLTQAVAAAKLGFLVPNTLVTQNRQAASRFVDVRRSVAKAISFGLLTDDSGQVAHTTAVDTCEFEGLEFCPVLLQEEIPKAREWRVTTVGDSVFAARTRDDVQIDKVDWRRSKDIKNIFEVATLPTEVTSRLLDLCTLNGIQFGAHDLIEMSNGNFVFLETNPAGQWGWLELTLGEPISAAIANLLSNGSSDFEPGGRNA
jgi:glutathione synthase/RimK-type ligase-like ATP-grasp enzyme